ncbi:MAG TPA: histidinol dehydrogenase, partial [Reyranella sp.]|nr:histidinol dehydrogenase [Reyranella sp.]
MSLITRLTTQSDSFERTLRALLAFDASQDESIERATADILRDVQARGDEAVLDYTRRFDRVDAPGIAALEIERGEWLAALIALPGEQRRALETAAERVRVYHDRQRAQTWTYTEADGTVLGQKITPLDRVGLYVPGGKAAYPSSVLMNAVPAKVAGVEEVIMVTPTPDGVRNPMVLAAAAIGG